MKLLPRGTGGAGRRRLPAIVGTLAIIAGMLLGGAPASGDTTATPATPAAPVAQPNIDPSGDGALTVNAAERDILVQQFVDRIKSKWGFSLQPRDYEVVVGDAGILIKRPDTPAKMTTSANGPTVSSVTSPKPLASGPSTLQSAIWQEKGCNSWWITRDNGELGVWDVGWFDSCIQWGTVFYNGQTRDHWVLRTWGTCATTGYYGFQECNHWTKPRISGMGWDDWSPGADMNIGNCRQITLIVTVEGIGASVPVTACDWLDITKGRAAGDFGTMWRGWAVHSERETANVIAIDTPIGVLPSLGFYRATLFDCTQPRWVPC